MHFFVQNISHTNYGSFNNKGLFLNRLKIYVALLYVAGAF